MPVAQRNEAKKKMIEFIKSEARLFREINP